MFDPVTATIATLALAGGYSAYQSKKSADLAKKQANDQAGAAKKLAMEEEKNKLQAVMRMQRRRGAVGEQGLRDTVITGALGLPSQPQTAQKTLLGQ